MAEWIQIIINQIEKVNKGPSGWLNLLIYHLRECNCLEDNHNQVGWEPTV